MHAVSPLQVIVPFDRFPLYETYNASLRGNMGTYGSRPSTTRHKSWSISLAQVICETWPRRRKFASNTRRVQRPSWQKSKWRYPPLSRTPVGWTPTCLKMFGFANFWHLARHENVKCTCYLGLYEAWLVLKYVPSHLSTGPLKENTTFWLYLLMPFSNAAMTLCSQSNRFIGTRCIRFFNHSTLLIYIRNKDITYFGRCWNLMKFINPEMTCQAPFFTSWPDVTAISEINCTWIAPPWQAFASANAGPGATAPRQQLRPGNCRPPGPGEMAR